MSKILFSKMCRKSGYILILFRILWWVHSRSTLSSSSRGCFTADGNAVVDILSTPALDGPLRVPYVSCPTNGFNLTCESGVPYSLPPPGDSVLTVSKIVSMADSDSASECGSDAHSESNCNIVQVGTLFCFKTSGAVSRYFSIFLRSQIFLALN